MNTTPVLSVFEGAWHHELFGADAYGAYEFDDLEPCRSGRRQKLAKVSSQLNEIEHRS